METELADSSEPPPIAPAESAGPAERPPSLGFIWVLLLFFSFRWLSLLLLRPGGFIRDWSDFDTYLGLASVSDYGLYPFLHYWLEWPPLVPWLAVGAYKLSLLLPAWPDDPRLWFVLILGTVFVVFETGNLALLYRISSRLYGTSGASSVSSPVLRPVWLYALLFVPLYAMLGFFDSVALFFLLLALDCALRERLMRSAMAVGIGFMVKLTPIIFLPVAVRHLWHLAESRAAGLRDGALYVVTTAVTVLALAAPFLLIRPVWLLTLARAVAGRSSWETVWAILGGYYGYGVVAGDRLNPAETAFAVHPNALPWLAIALVFAVFYLAVWLPRADYRQPRRVVALTGLTVTLFLLYSKGYSPQFLVYLLPFIVLLFPNRRGVAYSLLLTTLNILEQPVYFVLAPDARQLLVMVVAARWLVLGVLLFEFAAVIWDHTLRRFAGVRRYAPAGLTVVIALGLVAVLPAVARSYGTRLLRQDSAAPLIGYLTTGQATAQADLLVLDDQAMLRRFSPYLGALYTVRAAAGDNLPAGAHNLALDNALAGTDWLWFVGHTGEVRPGLGRSVLDYDFGAGQRLQLLARRGGLAAAPPPSRLANGINLIGYSVGRIAPGYAQATLYWYAGAPPGQSYTVFTQILDGEGNFIAGHDSFPANGDSPTHTWQTGRVYADTHVIELPHDLPAGTYNLVAGMYDFNLRRVFAARPDGGGFKDFAIPLGDLRLP
jgi:hypothetical protein